MPAANVTWTEAGTLRHKYSDVGVAVAIEGGLFTPVIRHAELKSLSEISNEMRDLAERARKRRLAPHEYQGGTTSISNLGMYGIKSFDAVINPPHATILAVGMGEKRPVVVGDKVEVATIVSCTLSCDHRVVDGAVGRRAAQCLQNADGRPRADAGVRRARRGGPCRATSAGCRCSREPWPAVTGRAFPQNCSFTTWLPMAAEYLLLLAGAQNRA